MFQTFNWPPQYTIKKHPRARHVKLRMSAQKGLELVTPLRFNLKRIPDILEQNRGWIEKQFSEMQHLPQEFHLPECITLHAINQSWQVSYMNNSSKLKMILRPNQELVMLGDIEETSQCQKLLVDWVKKQAKNYLLAQLSSLSDKFNLPISKASIRSQQTRWGSCSSKKAISLNYKLIFLPERLVHHTIIHELCHTIHLNHSIKFWKMVGSFDLNCQEHRKELRKANQYIPDWVPTK